MCWGEFLNRVWVIEIVFKLWLIIILLLDSFWFFFKFGLYWDILFCKFVLNILKDVNKGLFILFELIK